MTPCFVLNCLQRLAMIVLLVAWAGCDSDPTSSETVTAPAPAAPVTATPTVAAASKGFSHLAADGPETKALLEPVITEHLGRGRNALEESDLLGALNAYQTAGSYQSEQGGSTLAQHRIIAFVLAENPTLLSRESLGQAAQVLNGLLATDPTYKHVYKTAQANLVALSGNLDQAITTLRAVLETHPAYVPAREGLGVVLASSNKGDEAIKELRSVLKKAPDSVRARAVIAQLLSQAGDLEGAIDHARQAVKLASNTGNHLLLGELLQKKGDADEAIKQYRRAAMLNRQSALAFGRLGSVLLQKGGADKEARDMLNRAFELGPNGDVLYQLAIAEARLGDHDKALQYLARLANDSPNTPDVFQAIGEIQEQRGNTKNALSAYQRAHQLHTAAAGGKETEATKQLAIRIRKFQAAGSTSGPAPAIRTGASKTKKRAK